MKTETPTNTEFSRPIPIRFPEDAVRDWEQEAAREFMTLSSIIRRDALLGRRVRAGDSNTDTLIAKRSSSNTEVSDE